MNSWQAEYTYKGTVGSGAGFGYKFTSSAQFSTAPEEFFSKADMADMIKSKELAVMESINEAVYLPSNIEEFARRRSVLPLVKKVAKWAREGR